MIRSILTTKRLVKIVYILILTIAFIKIYSSIFDTKVSLVGDNASYYILGTAIANGDGYTNIQHLEKEAHYHYPPGYPVIIASVTKLFSNDIRTIKIVNGVLFFGAILLLFFIVKQLTQNHFIAFLVSLITMLNCHLLEYSTIMMSEIPFLFFSMLSLWLFIKIDFSKPVFKNGTFLLLLLSLSCSFYIRSVALALFASFVFFLFFKKKWTYLVSLVGGFMLAYFPWIIRNLHSTGNTYLSQLSLKNPYQPELGSIGFSELLERILRNAERYLTKEIPAGLVYTEDVVYSEASASVTDWLLGFFIVSVIAFGIYKLPKFRILILVYILAFFSLLLVWPSVWYGTRFLVPLLPLLIFLLVFGTIKFISWLSEIVFSNYKKQSIFITTLLIFGMWTFMYGKVSISKLQTKAEGVYTNNYQNYFALADWIHKNAPEESVTCVRKEGLFYLFSKKYVTNYLKTLDREAQLNYLKSKNVTYVVVEQLGYSSTSKYLVPIIDRYPKKFKIIKEFKNPNTYVLQFLPELGYSGTWENDKRNGLGTYVWEDGQKYVGLWKNDVRHGKGTLYFENGEQLMGVWDNGKLTGEVVKTGTNGAVIEKSIYENNEKVKVINEAH